MLALQEGDDFIKHRIEACMAGDQAAAERDRVRMVYDVRRRDAKSPWEVGHCPCLCPDTIGC